MLPGLTVGGTGNYLDAKITDVVPNTPYRVGDELPYAPKFSYSVYLEYSQMLPGSVRGYIRGDYNRHGNAVRDASSTSTQPSYQYDPWAVANLSVGASWNDWDAQLFVHNVLNSDDPLDYANFWGQWRVANMRPRTIGINVGRHF